MKEIFQIEVVKNPSGSAPEEIRKLLIGLVLFACPRYGFVVDPLKRPVDLKTQLQEIIKQKENNVDEPFRTSNYILFHQENCPQAVIGFQYGWAIDKDIFYSALVKKSIEAFVWYQMYWTGKNFFFSNEEMRILNTCYAFESAKIDGD